MSNWEREAARFAPGIEVRRYHGGERHLEAVKPDEVVLATYGMVRRDRAALVEVGWGLVVADEAQHVKNPLAHGPRAPAHPQCRPAGPDRHTNREPAQ